MEVKFVKKQLMIKLSFWEKLWSLHGDFLIPKANVVSINQGKPQSHWLDLKFPGTFLPGVIKAGTYLTRRGREFWYWRASRPYTYIVELNKMPHKRLILSVSEKIKL